MRSMRCAAAAAVQFLLLGLVSLAPSRVTAVSYEFQVTKTLGLPTEGPAAELTAKTAEPGQPAYRIIARQCVSGVCSTMGINSLAKAGNSLFSSDSLPEDVPFILNLRVQQQTLEDHGDEHIGIMTTQRTSVRRRAEGVREDDDPQPVLRVSAGRGGKEGPLGLLHPLYRIEQKHVVEYLVTLTSKQLRACAKNTCRFSTSATDSGLLSLPSEPVKIVAEKEPIALEFSIRLHEDPAAETKASVDHYVLASHFAEHAYKWGLENAEKKDASYSSEVYQTPQSELETVHMTPSTSLTSDGAGLSWSASSKDSRDGFPTSFCPTYRHVASIRGGKAHVWYLNNKVSSRDVPQIVIAFHGSQPKGGNDVANVGNEQFDLFKLSDTSDLRYLGKVARQYNQDYQSVEKELRDFIVPRSTVLVTGYSRSSGMATLATADLILDDTANVGKVYGVTFGSPQVGDNSFLRAFRRKVTQSPRYGYFKRIVAADDTSSTVKVDPEVLLPGGFNEYLSTFPAVKNTDCIRTFADVATLPRTASGHLSLYVHVGSQVLLFENGKQGPPRSTTAALSRPSSLVSSKSDVYDFANSMAPYSASGRMEIYVERLRLAQQQMLQRRLTANKQSLQGSSNLTLRKHVATLLKTLPWRASVAARPGDPTSADTNSEMEPPEGICSANDLYRQPMTVRLMLQNPDMLAGDERVAVSICEEKRKCHSMISVARDSQAMSTVPHAQLMRTAYYGSNRRYDPTEMKLKLSIVKQAVSPNCHSSMSAAFPPEQVTTKFAHSVPIEAGTGQDIHDSPSGKLRVGDLNIAYVVRMPLGGDAAIAAGGPYGDPSAIVSQADGEQISPATDDEVTQDQVVEAKEGTGDSDDTDPVPTANNPEESTETSPQFGSESTPSAAPTTTAFPISSTSDSDSVAMDTESTPPEAPTTTPSPISPISESDSIAMDGESTPSAGPTTSASPNSPASASDSVETHSESTPSAAPTTTSSPLSSVSEIDSVEIPDGEFPALSRQPATASINNAPASRAQIDSSDPRDTGMLGSFFQNLQRKAGSMLRSRESSPSQEQGPGSAFFPAGMARGSRDLPEASSPDMHAQAVRTDEAPERVASGREPSGPVQDPWREALGGKDYEQVTEATRGMVGDDAATARPMDSADDAIAGLSPEDQESASQYPKIRPGFPQSNPQEARTRTGELSPDLNQAMPSAPRSEVGRQSHIPPSSLSDKGMAAFSSGYSLDNAGKEMTGPGSKYRHEDSGYSSATPNEAVADAQTLPSHGSEHPTANPSSNADPRPDLRVGPTSVPGEDAGRQYPGNGIPARDSFGPDPHEPLPNAQGAPIGPQAVTASSEAGSNLPPVQSPPTAAATGAADKSPHPPPEIDIKVRSDGSMRGDRARSQTITTSGDSGSDAAMATGQAGEVHPDEIVEPEGEHRYEIGSNLLPMAPNKAKGRSRKPRYGLMGATTEVAQSPETDKDGDQQGDASEGSKFGPDVTCACTESSVNDCTTPVPDRDGRCVLSSCRRPRCDAGGSLVCNVKRGFRGPLHVVSASVDLRSISVGDEVDCVLDADAMLPVVRA